MIAGTLKGVVSQRLVPTSDGNGRVACCEILLSTGRVHDMILDPARTGDLTEVISEGAFYGMQTFDQHLLEHLQGGRITMEAALKASTAPHDFKLMVAAANGPAGQPAPTPAGPPPSFGAASPAPPGFASGAGAGSPPPPAPAGPPPGSGSGVGSGAPPGFGR